ncbi:hypothetical protein [Nioella sediminis]|jgi:hypothetical protein|uniref:hypothetical protein n=1 Tax=Nioella sediminis TaxID=1912092 RepID=UPI0008FD6686|nr:hypothetical protein [Nioella sediminis]TBX20512.1 hypothetical protein TK43_14610 [Roseovarius sp. JS7-11]
MEQDVSRLRPEEPARFNPERLELLCDEIGEIRAEHEVASALQAINLHLQNIRCLHPVGADLLRPVRNLAAASDRIGMATLARVARDVLACIGSGDPVALAATHARLLRVGERSIHAIWDLEDVTG